MIKTEEEFRQIPRLRVKRDEDGCYIATTIIGRLRGDHLYFHGPGKLGIYYQRNTKKAAAHAYSYWVNQLNSKVFHDLCAIGDYDGLIIFEEKGQNSIPGQFLRHQSIGFAKTPARSQESEKLATFLSFSMPTASEGKNDPESGD